MKIIPLYLTFACLCSSAFADGPAAETKAPTDVAAVARALHGVEPPSINLDFPGGSIDKFAATLTKEGGPSFSIIFNLVNREDAAEFAKIELPPFSLRNAYQINIAEMLAAMLEPRGFRFKSMGGIRSFVCLVEKIPAPEKTFAPQLQFLSYQLAPFLQSQSVDDIVEAVHTAWELDPSHTADLLHVKFHPGTSILLVSGPQEAITITRNVLVELKRSPEQKTAARTTEARPDKK